jgi:DnaJ-domain-containing protein 1
MVRTNDRDIEILNHSLKVCHENGGSINLHHAINFVKNLFSKKRSKKQPEEQKYYGYDPNNNANEMPDPDFFNRYKKQQEQEHKQENKKKEMPKPPPHIPEYKKAERKEYEYKAPPPPSYSRPYKKNEHHYATLGLTSDASPEEVNKTYKKLSLKLHPDKNANDPDATRKFQEMNAAYSAIVGRGIKKKVSFKDEKERMKYVRSHKKVK